MFNFHALPSDDLHKFAKGFFGQALKVDHLDDKAIADELTYANELCVKLYGEDLFHQKFDKS